MYTGLLLDGFTIILVLLHTHSVILSYYDNNEGSMTLNLDPEYLEHGFCLASQETHGFSTHFLCFIIDTIYSIGAFLFLMKYPKADAVNPGENDMMQTVPMTFMHGFLHLLGHAHPQDDQLSFVVDDGILVFSFSTIVTCLSLYFIAHMAHRSKLLALISASVTAIIVNCLVSKKLAFVVLNAFMYCTMSLSGMLGKKSSWYDAAALFGRLLPTIGTLIESTRCTDFVHYGGHALLFDGNIALGQTILLWAGFHIHYQKESKKVK